NPRPALTEVNGERLTPQQANAVFDNYKNKLPTKEYLAKQGFVKNPGQPEPADVFADQVKAVVVGLALGQDGVNRTYDNDKQLFNEALLRVWTKFFSQQLVGDIRPGFTGGLTLAKFQKSEFWDPVTIMFQNKKVNGLGLKKGVKPSDAIQELFTKAARTTDAQ